MKARLPKPNRLNKNSRVTTIFSMSSNMIRTILVCQSSQVLISLIWIPWIKVLITCRSKSDQANLKQTEQISTKNQSKMRMRTKIRMILGMKKMMASLAMLIATLLKVTWSIMRVLRKIMVGGIPLKKEKSKNKATPTIMCFLVRTHWRRKKVQDCSHGWMITRDLITDDLDCLFKELNLKIIKLTDYYE